MILVESRTGVGMNWVVETAEQQGNAFCTHPLVRMGP
jgi:hypothetical protein